MFNTGDIVQWGEDGSVKTFGRADDQVKIKVIRNPALDCTEVRPVTLTIFGTTNRDSALNLMA